MADENTAPEAALEEVVSTPAVSDEANASDSKSDIPAEVKQALKKANKEAETLRLKLKEYEDRDKTEAQKLQEERDALLAERDSLHMAQMRREVADEMGLTPAQAKRLVGSTREELEADAAEIAATFPTTPAKPKFGDVGQGPRGDSAQRVYTRAQIANFAFYEANKADILLAEREGRITN